MNTESDHPVLSNRTELNIVSRRVVAKGPSTLCLVIILDPFSRGHIELNDAATLTDACAANAVAMIFPVDCAIGFPIEVFTKVRRGIVVSKVPCDARFVLTYFVDEQSSVGLEVSEARH